MGRMHKGHQHLIKGLLSGRVSNASVGEQVRMGALRESVCAFEKRLNKGKCLAPTHSNDTNPPLTRRRGDGSNCIVMHKCSILQTLQLSQNGLPPCAYPVPRHSPGTEAHELLIASSSATGRLYSRHMSLASNQIRSTRP